MSHCVRNRGLRGLRINREEPWCVHGLDTAAYCLPSSPACVAEPLHSLSTDVTNSTLVYAVLTSERCAARRRRIVTARMAQANPAAGSVQTASMHSSSPSSRRKARSTTSRPATRSAWKASTPWCRTAACLWAMQRSSLLVAWQAASPGSSRCCGGTADQRHWQPSRLRPDRCTTPNYSSGVEVLHRTDVALAHISCLLAAMLVLLQSGTHF